MTLLRLTILSPANGDRFKAGTVRFTGRVDSTPSRPPVLSWYSSLNVPADPKDPALNRQGDDPLDFSKALEVGTHVITFASRDVAGDTLDKVASVAEGGMAGGPAQAPNPCVVTMFRATLLEPAASGAVLSKADATLAVRAPVAWASPRYQDVNKVAYAFDFRSGGPTVRLTPGSMTFVAGNPPLLRFRGALPAQLAPGTYQLVARAYDHTDPGFGDESTPLPVTVAA